MALAFNQPLAVTSSNEALELKEPQQNVVYVYM